MRGSTERILTTHVGSLARPHALLHQLQARVNGEPYDADALATLTANAVTDVVRQQADNGIDVVSDGEQSKAGFYGYVAERLSGFEISATPTVDDRASWRAELDQFPEYYQEYLGGKNRSTVRNPALICSGPLTYVGQAVLQQDLDNLNTALQGVHVQEAFVPSLAPRELGTNQYYARPRTSCPRSARRCAPNTWPLSTLASSCRSTIHG